MAARILDGKALAAQIRSDLRGRVGAFSSQAKRAPHLAVVLASDDPASAIYVRNKGKAAEEVGIQSTQHTLPSDTSREDLLALIARLNLDPGVDAILVQLPLPKQHTAAEVIAAISPAKDADGLHPINAGRLARGDEGSLIPCTPAGCIRLLEHAGVDPLGKRAVVLGRSSLVGRPMADLLVNRSATVTVCHSKTKELAERVREAEIVIAAIGQAEMIRGSWFRPGAVVIDVGMNKRADGKLCGDVFFPGAAERAAAITPVPGGVGPMTIALLLENTLRAARLRSSAMVSSAR
jgi:methylenetetrahydrofolate dehydrogenase (NADP+)/methenyltetrahydrofolate cyclohydrolase